jgi:hypothetical protein
MKSTIGVAIVFLATSLAACSRPAVQSSPLPFQTLTCGPDGQSGTYANCALRIEHGRLKRGTQGEVLAKKPSLGPVPLTRFVAGDSARFYAMVYEDNTKRAAKFSVIGTTSLVFAYFAAHGHLCGRSTCSPATNRARSLGFVGVGVGLNLVSVPFWVRAAKASNHALWLHNSPLDR